MAPRIEKKFYLNNGRLDLSSLSEYIQMPKQENSMMEITDRELLDLQEGGTLTTLEEMALMFETEEVVADQEVPSAPPVQIEDEFTKAFNEKRLQEEMQEFGIKRLKGIDKKDR